LLSNSLPTMAAGAPDLPGQPRGIASKSLEHQRAIVGKLFDSNGTTLLNPGRRFDTAITSGGIAFRATGSDKYFDTVTATYGVNTFAKQNTPAVAPVGGWQSFVQAWVAQWFTATPATKNATQAAWASLSGWHDKIPTDVFAELQAALTNPCGNPFN